MSEKLKTVVVDRAKWFRGQDADTSRLKIQYAEKYCCLGFCAIEAGLKKVDIAGVCYPSQIGRLDKYVEAFPLLFTKKTADSDMTDSPMTDSPMTDSPICDRLARTNDDEDLAARERERRIKALGKKAGIRFKFIGK